MYRIKFIKNALKRKTPTKVSLIREISVIGDLQEINYPVLYGWYFARASGHGRMGRYV
ncbi:MAG: hypothetical protein V7L27_23550 [Nostoc sp.]|uniref:hypothetical protein n=1 Tax=Nostoc sp. TaxID=1180 RepID=UPI002FFCAE84